MTILPKAIYRFNEMLSKSQQNTSQTIKEEYSTSHGKAKKPRIAKTILYNKRTSGGITIPDFKHHYRATELKTVWHCIRTDRRTNGTESKTQILIHTPLNIWFSRKKQKIRNRKKTAYLTNGAGITGYQHVEEWK